MKVRVLLVAVIVLAGPRFVGAQDAVMRSVSDEKLEGLLTKERIEFTRAESDKGTSVWVYERNGFKMRLFSFGGKDLMIDAEFGKSNLDSVNAWNSQAKFTRATLRKAGKGEYAMLESNLDLTGGVTEGAIKQFINNFDRDVKAFSVALTAVVVEEEILRPVTSSALEGLMKSLKLEFKKAEGKNGNVYYDFERSGKLIELTNFAGKDLMIAARFTKLPLEKVNKWNLDRKFVRAVLYPGAKGNPDYVALESNLDCAAGCSESMIRSFITSFDFEVRAFTQFLSAGGAAPPGKGDLVRPDAGKAAELKVFVWDEGKCSMLMPGKPMRQVNKFKSPTGEDRELVMMIIDEGNQGNRGWALLMTEVPEARNANDELIEQMLDGGRDGAVKNLKGKILSEKRLKLDDKHAGRDLVVEGIGLHVRVRFYVVGDRLYQTMVLGPRDYVTSEEADRILTSFKLMK